MVTYLKTFKVLGTTYGIEDHKQPGDHFFPRDYKTGKRKRFENWSDGCGIGQFDTLEEAEQDMEEYIRQDLGHKIRKATQALSDLVVVQNTLFGKHLKGFQVPKCKR